MSIKISKKILEKLASKTPPVKPDEVAECFLNRQGGLLFDKRAQHATNPPTQWFISETDKGRKLKVVFVQNGADSEIKTAYDPNSTEEFIYLKFGMAGSI